MDHQQLLACAEDSGNRRAASVDHWLFGLLGEAVEMGRLEADRTAPFEGPSEGSPRGAVATELPLGLLEMRDHLFRGKHVATKDGSVSIWRLKGNGLELKETRSFGGPVYKANFNFLGNMIAISYCNDAEERI